MLITDEKQIEIICNEVIQANEKAVMFFSL